MRLKDIIRRKVNEADLNPGKLTTPHEFDGGLRMVIKKTGDSYAVYISRAGSTAPSKTELQTLLHNWPHLPAAAEEIRSGITFTIKESKND